MEIQGGKMDGAEINWQIPGGFCRDVASRSAIIVAAWLLTGSASAEPDARSVVLRALATMSAGKDVAALQSFNVRGREVVKDLVENDHPLTAPFYTASNQEVDRAVDLQRMIERSETKAGDKRSTAIFSRRASFASPTSDSRSRVIAAAPPAWIARDPITSLRAAILAPDLRREPDAVRHGVRQIVVMFRDGRFPVRIYVDVSTGLPSATEAVVSFDDASLPEAIAWNAMGDIVERTEYLNWTVIDGVRYPLQQNELRNGDLLRSYSIDVVTWDSPLEFEGRAQLADNARPAVTVQDYRPGTRVPGPYPDKPISEIAPGVVQIPNSWFTTIVRQDDGLVILDAPISAGYSKGVIEEARRRFPGFRIKAVVTSTGFFWHVGGIREYAALGIPIYAEVRNVPVIERILRSPHTLVPDNLSRKGALRATVIPVAKQTVVGRGRNSLELYPVRATQPMLMTYIRDGKILHTAEMVQPLGPGGSMLFPESLIELRRTVSIDGLDVDRIIGMHMAPTPWHAVADAISAAGAKEPSP